MTRQICAALLGGILLAANGSTPNAARVATDLHTTQHVLNRITFGARPGDVERVQAMGVDAFIDQQLHPERNPDGDLPRRLAGFETLTLDSREIARRYEIPAVQARRQRQTQDAAPPATPPTREELAADPVRRAAALPLQELQEQKIVRAVYSEHQLEEVLTDFWFNHFNADARKGPTRFMLTEYEREAIRPHVFGRFRDLLGATAKSPAMLFYLDNWMSTDPNGPHRVGQNQAGAPRLDQQQRSPQGVRSRQRGGIAAGARGAAGQRGAASQESAASQPGATSQQRAAGQQGAAVRPTGLNENYGRELLELHTLGVDGGYTQKDVTEVARAFTGWSIEMPRLGGGFRFAPAMHDNGEKTVLGHVIKAGGGQRDGEAVLDILATHPATARFISSKLARRFVSDHPPQALVDRMAAAFQKSDGDLRLVMTVLLTSKEFLSPEAERTKVKSPFEFVVSSLRATGAEMRNARPVVRAVAQLGMPLYQCQPPTGYSDAADVWVNTGALINRMNVASTLAAGRLPGVALPAPPRPESIVGFGMSETTRDTIAKAQTSEQALALALGSPEFQRR